MSKLTKNSNQNLKCTSCGAELPAGTRFCEQCGQSVLPNSSAESDRLAQPAAIPSSQWELNISTLKNPLLWFQLVMVSLVSSSYLLLLLLGLNLYERHWEEIPASFAVGVTISVGLFSALSLVLILLYWRGVPTRYVLQDKCIEQHTLVGGKKAAGILSIFGILSGKSAGYTAAGATLLAQSREKIAVNWKDVTSLKKFPKRNEIQLHNDWRTTMQVICPTEQFDTILRFIQKKTEKNSHSQPLSEHIDTPFAQKVILSIFAILFGIFLFPRLPIHYVGIFAIATAVIALLALWSSGSKKRILGGILVLLPIVGCALAFAVGEVDMSEQGAVYALIIELIMLGYFMLLGLGVTAKHIR